MNILDKLPVGIITLDENFNITFVNETFFQFERFLRLNKEGLINSPITEISAIYGELKEEIQELQNLVPFEKEIDFDKKILGKFLSVIVKGVPVTEDEKFTGALLLYEDLIVAAETHEESILRTKQFKDAISVVSDFYCLADKEGKIIYSSDAKFETIIPGEAIIKAIKENDFLIEPKKGEYFKIAYKPVILKDKGNELIFISLKNVTTEISEKNNLKNRLKAAQLSHSVINSVYSPVLLINSEGGIEYANSSVTSLFGKNTGKLSKIERIVPEITIELISEVLFSPDIDALREIEIKVSGKQFKIQLKKFDKSSSLLLAEFFDTTEQKNEIEKLEEKLNILKKLFYRKNIIIKYNSKGQFLELSENHLLADEIFGDKKSGIEKIIPVNRDELFPQTESSFSFDKNGRVFFGHVVKGSDGYYLGVSDETERIKEKKKSEELEKRYNDLAENITEFFWQSKKINEKFTPPVYSDNSEKIIGYSADELNRNPKLWLKLIHPNDKKDLIRELRLFYSNKALSEKELVFRVITKNRKIIWLREIIKVKRDSAGNAVEIFAALGDVTSLMSRQEELKQKVDELEAMNSAKDRFVSIISHDLRTPFSSVLGFTDLLLNDNTLPEEKRREYIQYIQDSSNTMLNLVNSLLDWTRLQTGRIQFNPEKLSLSEVAQNSLAMLQGTAMKKGINLASNIDRNYFVHADKNLLSQVFNNLLGNAIKFTKAGDSISITARKPENSNVIEVTVADTGTGIREEDIPKLFRPDSKFTNLGTAGEKGTGLGLSLVSEIIKKHRGEIKVESKLGEGTKFIFTIPISSSLILLTDENQTDLLLYSKLIKSLFPEFIIETAKEKEEIERIISEKAPVLILSETNIENYSIFNLLEFLKTNVKKIKPSVIVLTRKISPKEAKVLESQGVRYVFSKPVDLSEFRSKILEAIKSSA